MDGGLDCLLGKAVPVPCSCVLVVVVVVVVVCVCVCVCGGGCRSVLSSTCKLPVTRVMAACRSGLCLDL